ncbi:tetratricopeptide repeat protein [Candidatus Kuenenia stuttgartensis]|uniref:tetratricopeptide repeat protein n=1 Tax=Kuenenia stuttgartiensis TaxID=174633 RepID=UPI00146B6AE2|nr:tetratricopeptide repeat protein [Candidatus Kuenenia stuttgartiensis]
MKQKYAPFTTTTIKFLKLLLKRKHWFFVVPFFLLWLNFVALKADEQILNATIKMCPKCNELYQNNEKFCGKDGTVLSDTNGKLVCPVCKKEGSGNEKFCVEHGEKLIPIERLSARKDPADLERNMSLAAKYYQEGNTHCDNESYDLALKSYLKAEEVYPDLPGLHYNMGWLYSKLGDVDSAVDHLQKYIILAPDSKDITEVRSYIALLKQAHQKKLKLLKSTNRETRQWKRRLKFKTKNMIPF